MRGYPRFVLDLSSIVLDLSSICPRFVLDNVLGGNRGQIEDKSRTNVLAVPAVSSIYPRFNPTRAHGTSRDRRSDPQYLDLSSICPRFVLDLSSISSISRTSSIYNEDNRGLSVLDGKLICPRFVLDLSSICPRFVFAPDPAPDSG